MDALIPIDFMLVSGKIRIMGRTKDKRFKKDYSKNDIIKYLKGIYNLLGKSPTYREVKKIPGPSPSTVIRRFGYWSKALKEAGIRPKTHQLKKGERTYIRSNWRHMTDEEIAHTLGVTNVVIKHYRMNLNLWKNRKFTARSTFRKKALKLYGKECEVCGLNICEWHHIIPKSVSPTDWAILCSLCHAVITRKLVVVTNRKDLNTKLKPFMKDIYSKLKI